MNYTEFISELIDELSYRVGVPNIYDKEHQRIMSEILTEWGKFDEKKIIFEFLTEDDEKRFSSPILNRKIKYTGKDGKEREGLVGNLLTSPKDSPGRIEAEKLLPAPGTPEREKINKEIGSQGGGGEQDSEGGGETPQEEPKQGQALSKNTKSGKSYHDRVVSKEEETRAKMSGEPDKEQKTREREIQKNLSKEQKSARGLLKKLDIEQLRIDDPNLSDEEIEHIENFKNSLDEFLNNETSDDRKRELALELKETYGLTTNTTTTDDDGNPKQVKLYVKKNADGGKVPRTIEKILGANANMPSTRLTNELNNYLDDANKITQNTIGGKSESALKVEFESAAKPSFKIEGSTTKR